MELDYVEAGVLEDDAVEFDHCNEAADMEAETCGLCMEIVVDRGLLDCCQHWFCFACIDNWSTITNLCPLCQSEFQLITCVPVYDTVGNNKFEEELFPREDDWCVEGNNNTLSFPSYYIDENAVVCLDGDGCKIRAGSSSAEGDASLDTSIACDSCDIWYHAFCVGFDTEDTSESTWLCPRCTNELQGETGTSYADCGDSSCQEKTTSLVENSSGGKLSVSVADAGETAIVVSMVTGDHSIQGCNVPSPTIQDTECKTETVEGTSEFQGDKVQGGSMVESEKTIPSLESEDLGSSLSMDESFGFHHSIASSKLMENSDLHVQVGGMVTSGTGNGLVEEVPSQILSDKALVKDADDQSIVDSQNTVVKTNAAKRRHTDASDDNEGSRAKRKKVKARHAKRSRADGKVSPEEFYPLSPRADMHLNGETVPDIMSIVQGSEAKPPKASSLRVKKIMKRPIEDKESSTALEKLRQEIREAVRNRSAEESENLFDPKLLVAFRAVVTGPKAESVTKLSPLALKAKKSLLHKGKVRESLTKKIYGNSNGRRKRAWDRDCEVEFWKYRCKKTMRPEKIETLKSVLSLLRKGSECSGVIKEPEQSPADSILTRLYFADTSVLPRKDDIKPLSNYEDATKPEQKKAQNIPGNSANRSLAATSVEASARGSNSASNITKDRASLKTPSIKRAEGSVPCSIGASKGNANLKKEAHESGGDARVDKRKWALELLARKTASAGKGASDGDGDAALLKGNYPLLAQLPVDRRPTLAPCRHNKIPLSVRQTQLYRLTEHFLKKANLSSLVSSAETELAVADAVNIEKKVADRSSSKLVYMNLCSQELLHRSGNSQSNDTPMEANPSSTLQEASSEHSKEEVIDKLTDPEVEAALRATGLLSDSPVGSPNCTTVCEIDNEQITHLSEDGPENILELDSNPELDIYGDFEYDLGDEDYVGASTIQVPVVQPEEGEAKMKVVFSSLQSEKSTDVVESASSEPVGNESSLPEKTDSSKGTLLEDDVGEKFCEPEKVLSGEGDEPSAAECEELYGPEKEPVIHNYAEGVSENDISGYRKSSELDIAVKQSGASSNDEKSTVGREFNGDTRSINNRNEGQTEEKAETDVDKHSDGVNSVTKKVETYIKEHIRPLCKSGVISPDQYRWAVSKTTDKVMKYHSNSKNANFLIKEGEKVKRLAEQYVEAAQKRPKGDS